MTKSSFFCDLCPEPRIFSNAAFSLSGGLKIIHDNTINPGLIIIDNFYEDIELVLSEIKKFPIAKVGGENWHSLPDFFDGRICYSQTMSGTHLPFIGQLPELLGNLSNYEPKYIEILDKLIVNCFAFSEEANVDDFYYGVHIDPQRSGVKGQLAMVIFLNANYQDGEGINFYEDLGERQFKSAPLFEKELIKRTHFIQARPNRAVVFDSTLTHGQAIGSNQFTKELRYTQVIFCAFL